MPRTVVWMQPHIGVVIAGDCRHPVWRAKLMQPVGGEQEFLRQPDIDEVSGHRDVVGPALGNVAGQDFENIAAMNELPPAMPIDIAQHALAHEIAAARPRHGAQMDVGEMG